MVEIIMIIKNYNYNNNDDNSIIMRIILLKAMVKKDKKHENCISLIYYCYP